MNFHDPDMRAVPTNIEAEQALLGAILVNNAAYDRVSRFLEPQHFSEPIHKRIFEVIGDTLKLGKLVTPVLIKSFLPDVKIGDVTMGQYLALLAAESVTIINVVDYAQAIHEMWIRRQAISEVQSIADLAFDLPPDRDILAEIGPVEDRLAELRAERVRGETREGIGTRYLNSLTAAQRDRRIIGVPIGLAEIARVISEPCFEPGNLYGLLSSSGEGKTSMTLQIITDALKQDHPAIFLSFDQSADQCIRQMAAQEYAIEARRQRVGDLSEKEWGQAVDFSRWIDRAPLEIVKCTDHSAAQLVSFARPFIKRKGNGKTPLVVVDHIGAVKPEDRRADEGTKAKDINKILKAGAEMTQAAWLVLNQRNSWGMKRDNPRPISADLFGGDPAKQAYDAIFYVYRFKKFFEERKAIATSDQDWKKIAKTFPEPVRDGSVDLAELGAIKVRFGTPYITETLIFEGRYTRYRSEREPMSQEELL